MHALVDAEGRPIRLKLTEGQAHDGRSAADMFETLEAGHTLLADRAGPPAFRTVRRETPKAAATSAAFCPARTRATICSRL
ncbi:MAG: hypothetical protein ABJP67_15120 [Nitratireductor sp.]